MANNGNTSHKFSAVEIEDDWADPETYEYADGEDCGADTMETDSWR